MKSAGWNLYCNNKCFPLDKMLLYIFTGSHTKYKKTHIPIM